MRLALCLALVPATTLAFGDLPQLFFPQSGVGGYCASSLDTDACSFNYGFEFDSLEAAATACYGACVTDFPDLTIENVEVGGSFFSDYCYCQTDCPYFACSEGSVTATIFEDYYIPPCVEDDVEHPCEQCYGDCQEFMFGGENPAVTSINCEEEYDLCDELTCENSAYCESFGGCSTECIAEINTYCSYCEGGEDIRRLSSKRGRKWRH